MKQSSLSLILICVVSFIIILSCNSESTVSVKNAIQLWGTQYNEDGRIKEITMPGGTKSTFSYQFEKEQPQKINQIVRKTKEEKVIYDFDKFSRMVSMLDQHGKVTYQYDEFNRLTKVSRGEESNVSYSYDVQNRPKKLYVGSTLIASYEYDFLGRLSKVGTPAGDINYEYWTSDKRVIRKLPNGVKTYWIYSQDGKLESISNTTSENNLISEYKYSYTPSGLIEQILEWSNSNGEIIKSYEYDEVGRLTFYEDSQKNSCTFVYDEYGNRKINIQNGVENNASYDSFGRLTKFKNEPCRHNKTSSLENILFERDVLHFDYSAENLLTGIENKESGLEIKYQYDGDGKLISRMADGNQTKFVNDPLADIWKPLKESGGDSETYYIWQGNSPLAKIKNGKVFFYLHDHLGSIRTVLGSAGEVTQQLTYGPFGVPAQTVKDKNYLNPGFTGLFYEPTASLYLTKHRAYAPHIAQFLQLDPIHQMPSGTQKDLSAYGYCGGDPVNFLDILGTQSTPNNYQGFLDYINGGRHKKFDYVLGTGLGSGVDSYKKLALLADGRFNAIVVTGNEKGPSFDLLKYAIWDTGGGARKKPIPVQANVLVSHSGANFTSLSNTHTVLRLDPGSYLLSQSDIYKPGIVSNLTGVDLNTPLSNELIGISFTGQSDKLFGSPVEAVGDFFRFGKGLLQATGRSLAMPFTGTSPFESHNLKPMLKDLEIKEKIPSSGSYPSVEIIKLNSTGTIEKTFIYKYPKPSISELNKGSSTIRNIKKRRDEYSGMNHSSSNNSNGPGGPGGGGNWMSPPHSPGPGGFSPMKPTKVGGVYLKNAGQSLKGLSQIKGIAIDDSGRLVFLSDQIKDNITLPSLRMDDVVTIFRSVYEHGSGPYVSIDPIPENPEGPYMKIRHDPGTKGTFVGWVLFEADRIMKVYSLGRDNLMDEPFHSEIKGYKNILQLGSKNDEAEIWERFWIVPAEIDRKQTEDGKLTLFDVSLKVMTERMVMKNGELVSAPNPESSLAGKKFAEWFTENYDNIAKESRSPTPKGNQLDTIVDVFNELQRMTLITAIAENLREQGVPMPHWMRDYEVSPFRMPKTTPSTIAEDNNSRIYGGAKLTPNDKFVHTISGDHTAQLLQKEVSNVIEQQASFQPVSIRESGKEYTAVVLPGNNSLTLASCVMQEPDLIVPITNGFAISLTRNYNSFFSPSGSFGKHWTMDLPRLMELKAPVSRKDDVVTFKTTFEISTPLNSYFDQAPKILIGKDARIGYETQLILLPDAQRWHFDQNGNLFASQQSGYLTVYRRNKQQQIETIEGWFGNQKIATIDLRYNKDGFISEAKSNNGSKVTYQYKEGRLSSIKEGQDNLEYKYDKGLISGVYFNDEPERQYKYNTFCQLSGIKIGEGDWINYKMKKDKNGTKLQVVSSKGISGLTMEYDNQTRPLKQTFEDGASLQWTYGIGQSKQSTLSFPSGDQYIIKQSKDGSKRSFQSPQGSHYESKFDADGRLTNFLQGGETVLKQDWYSNGLLKSLEQGGTLFQPEYDENEIVRRISLESSNSKDGFRPWADIQLDNIGRINGWKDYSGSEIEIQYDTVGNVMINDKKRSHQTLLKREKNIIKIQTSLGYEELYQFSSDNIEKLESIKFKKGNTTSFISFDQGKISKMQQFDRSEYTFSYNENGLISSIKAPNGLLFHYAYDANNQLSNVKMGEKLYSYQYNEDGDLIACYLSAL